MKIVVGCFKTCGDITEIIKNSFNDVDNLCTTTCIEPPKPNVIIEGTITIDIKEYRKIVSSTPYDLNNSTAIKAREKHKWHEKHYINNKYKVRK